MVDFDLVTVGGGLAGSSLAKVTAERGARVLVLEHEVQFRDRVRGEAIVPWGVAEARTLGLEAPLVERGAQAVPGWTNYRGGEARRRDLPSTTPSGAGLLNYYHPMMQETFDRACRGSRRRSPSGGDRDRGHTRCPAVGHGPAEPSGREDIGATGRWRGWP
jgi:2-polyprenyl-6-methoxyphenol hydroxylase-like FAD-dependent oxidoreductase